MITDPTINDSPDGSIPVETAKTWAANWRTHLANPEQTFAGRSFLIPIVSINTLLANNPTVESVRAYIGLEDATDPLTAKLILVPVVAGEEVHTVPGEFEGDDRSTVVDLAVICPPYCPTGGGPTLES